jgi:carboxymethylenebutenolidase
MCDEDIHQGQPSGLSRRAFAATAAAAGLAGPAHGAPAHEVIESDVSVTTADGRADAVLIHPASGRWPAVLIWTDILGLRPVFREMGRRLAGEGYVVLVPNPFYRIRPAPVVDLATFKWSDPADRARLTPLAGSLTPEGSARDAHAFIGFLDAQTQTDTARKAGVQGYCMGGPLALRTAAAVPKRIAALATFHGGGLVTDKPDSPHLLIPTLRAQAFCGVADNDDAREPASKTTLRQSFAAAGLSASVQVFAGANHGWCVKDGPAYNALAAERAWADLGRLYTSALV